MSFPTGTVTWMREAQEAVMQDTCKALTFVDGDPVEGSALACGLTYPLDAEEASALYVRADALEFDALARLPEGTDPDTMAGIRVTHRYGEALDADMDFEVVGVLDEGVTALTVLLRKL